MSAPEEAVAFLEQLRPGGPWILSAIVPDGTIETITACKADDVRAFVTKYNGTRNLYLLAQPDARADDQEGGEDRHRGDRVPAERPRPEAGRNARGREKTLPHGTRLSSSPDPAAIIDSGNGIQLLLKLAQRIDLPDAGDQDEREGQDREGRQGTSEKGLSARDGSADRPTSRTAPSC